MKNSSYSESFFYICSVSKTIHDQLTYTLYRDIKFNCMKKFSFLFLALFLSSASFIFAQTDDQAIFVQKEFTIKVIPNDAEVFNISSTGAAEKMSVGSRVMHADKDVYYKLEFRKDGYQSTQRIYYRQKGGVDQDIVELEKDEAYTQSEESNLANINFNISVKDGMTANDAWKTIAGIVESYFDEIQTMDATTSYLRTNWVSSIPFNKTSRNRRIIRTQVVVTSASTNPIKYNVKIKSEISKTDKECTSGDKLPAVNRDECFEPFSRILRKYNDMINEIQRRMQ